ncbi:DUF4129 domain-containing protein [Pseudonocardiaceae bacterium YIM PH 21723]|nr:DUF4129 domain-containing protein [Pseudonocardiaceae bacterium YIM PH 21723]
MPGDALAIRSLHALLCIAITVATTPVYQAFFATTEFLPTVLGAACCGGVIAAAVAIRRPGPLPTVIAALAGASIFAAYGVLTDTLRGGLPTGRTAAELGTGAVRGWSIMLSVGLPAEPRGVVLVTPALLTWFAAFGAVTLALRTSRPFAPLGPPVLALAAALPLVGGDLRAQPIAMALGIAAALVLATLRGGHGRPGVRLAIIALATAVGVLAGPLLASGTHRADPRDLRATPVRADSTLSPLALIKNQLRQSPAQPLFTVRIDQGSAAQLDRIRVAALPEYNGELWTAAGEYRFAGRRFAGHEELPGGTRLTAEIELQGLGPPFLPVLGEPTRLELHGQDPGAVGVDAGTGTAMSTAADLRNWRYRTEGLIRRRDGDLENLTPGGGPAFDRYRAVQGGLAPGWAAELRKATETAQGPLSAYAGLRELEKDLLDQPEDLSVPAGHSIGALNRALTRSEDPDLAVYREFTGYSEQRAAIFTLLAREQGYPARVAVGYKLRVYRNGEFRVTGHDAFAWPEVHFDGYGWVPFGPADTKPVRNVDGHFQPPPVLVDPVPAPPPAQRPAQQPEAQAGEQDRAGWTGALTGWPLAVALLLVFPACLAGIALAKAWRHRRRRAASTLTHSVLGAWQQAVDRLTERGVRQRAAETAAEYAQRALRDLGPAARPLTELAPLASAAVFAPHTLDTVTKDEAWQLATELDGTLYPKPFSVPRLRAAVDPRPLYPQVLARRLR